MKTIVLEASVNGTTDFCELTGSHALAQLDVVCAEGAVNGLSSMLAGIREDKRNVISRN